MFCFVYLTPRFHCQTVTIYVLIYTINKTKQDSCNKKKLFTFENEYCPPIQSDCFIIIFESSIRISGGP